ncbi:MAG: hypothetical protein R3C05_19170 [Pirellulaceae bacterium]
MAITGSVAFSKFTNSVEASIGSGAKINQDAAYRNADQSVTVDANTTMDLTELAGIIAINIAKPHKWKELGAKNIVNPVGNKAESLGVGGSVLVQDMNNTTIARVADGAQVHTGTGGSLSVNADETFTTIDIAQAGAAVAKLASAVRSM